MIRQIDEALLALQSALFAREHYGADHPAVTKALERARARIEQAIQGRDELRVFCAAGRVVALGKALPSSEGLRDGIFARLADRGVSSLTFSADTTREDLDALTEWLLSGEGDWNGSTRLRAGTVVSGAEPTPTTNASISSGALDPGQQVVAVREVWTAASREDWNGVEGLESVVSAICGAVSGSSGMLLPLATLKRHDEYTFVHTTNVAILTASLAESVGLRDAQVIDLTTAALLHDVGKRSVPRALLNKKDKLSDSELRLMRRHPVLGARILFDSRRVPDVVPIVAFEHHIHLDGSGYPHVCPGWRTSLASQIVQVADVYDALRTHRPYRRALSQDDAFDLMMRDAGVRFDRSLLTTFFERVASRTEREAMPEVWDSLSDAA